MKYGHGYGIHVLYNRGKHTTNFEIVGHGYNVDTRKIVYEYNYPHV